jgi:hypothetical protein
MPDRDIRYPDGPRTPLIRSCPTERDGTVAEGSMAGFEQRGKRSDVLLAVAAGSKDVISHAELGSRRRQALDQ